MGGQSPAKLYPQVPAAQPTVLGFEPLEPRFVPYGLLDVPWGSRARVKLPRPPADPAHMLAASLSTDVWLGVGFISAITVLACLGVIANILRYELEFIRVVAGAKKLREKLVDQIDEVEAQHPDQANPAAGRPEMIDSPSPMPASAETDETEAIIDSPPEPESEPESEPDVERDAKPNAEPEPDAEPAATDSAQAA